MSFIRFNNAEGGTNGATVSAANSGGASGYAFDVFSGASIFSNTVAQSGSQSYTSSTTGVNSDLIWNLPSLTSTIWARSWFYFPSLLSNGVAAIISLPSPYAGVSLQGGSTNTLYVGNGTGNTSGSYTYSAATWYRVEVQLNYALLQVTARVYDNSGNLLETITSPQGSTAWGVMTSLRFYLCNDNAISYYQDNLAVSDQGWIGTATGSSVGPVAKSNNALSGTPGTTVSTANSGGLSGDAFDVINGSPAFSATVLRPSGGWLSYYCSSQNMQWNLPGTSADIYTRAYVYLTSETANQEVTQFRATATVVASSFFNSASSGKLAVNVSGPSSVTGTYVPAISTWYRVETHTHISATVGYTEAYLYAMSGSQLDYVTTAQTGNSSGVSNVELGQGAISQNAYYDSLALSDVTWCGAAGNPAPMLLADMLHGNSLDTTKWTGAYGTLSYAQTGMTITNPISYTGYGGINSISSYNLTGSTMYCRMPNAGNQSLTSLQVYPIQLQLSSGNVAGFIIAGGNVQAFSTVAGTTTYSSSVTYSSTTHLWFRIRESGGTMYWDTSPDSQTWNAFYSVANPFAVTALSFVIAAGTYSSEASATTIIVDMVNSPAAIAPVGGQFNRYNNAEGGTSGTAVTSVNSGGVSGYAFDAFGATLPTFDNSQFFTGTLSYKLTAAASQSNITWNIPGSTSIVSGSIYTRCYVYFLTSAFTNGGVIVIAASGSTPKVTVASGKFVAWAGTTSTSGVTSLSAGTWYRIETQVNFSTTTPSTVVRLYNASGTLLETITATGSGTVSTIPTSVNFGIVSGSNTGTLWIDEPAVSSAGWIGAAVGNAVGPVSKANNAAGGTNGVAVSVANSGGASGDAFDTVTTPTNFSWLYPRPGSSPLNYLPTANGAADNWNVPGTVTDIYFRCYYFVAVTPTALITAYTDWQNVGSQNNVQVSSGLLVSQVGNGSITRTGVTAYTLNTWVRIEGRIHFSTPGWTEAYWYDASGNQLDHVIAFGTNIIPRFIQFLGSTSRPAAIDSLALSDQGWIGPAANLPIPPLPYHKSITSQAVNRAATY